MIRDNLTGVILFSGHVADPTAVAPTIQEEFIWEKPIFVMFLTRNKLHEILIKIRIKHLPIFHFFFWAVLKCLFNSPFRPKHLSKELHMRFDLLMHFLHMGLQRFIAPIALWTNFTFERFDFLMNCLHMFLQKQFFSKSFATSVTLESKGSYWARKL